MKLTIEERKIRFALLQKELSKEYNNELQLADISERQLLNVIENGIDYKITKIKNGFIIPSNLYGSTWSRLKRTKNFLNFRNSEQRTIIINSNIF